MGTPAVDCLRQHSCVQLNLGITCHSGMQIGVRGRAILTGQERRKHKKAKGVLVPVALRVVAHKGVEVVPERD